MFADRNSTYVADPSDASRATGRCASRAAGIAMAGDSNRVDAIGLVVLTHVLSGPIGDLIARLSQA